eukprot:41187_1
MSLYEENTQEPTTHDHVHDEVFVHVLKYLQTIAKKHMAKITQNAPITDNEIQWIVTVPAIWSEKAKKRMKHFIIKAGLVSEYVKDQCLIVYEPDCAALCIFEEQKNKPIKAARILYFLQHEWDIIGLEDAEHRRLKPICTTISKFIGPAHLTLRTGSQYMLIDAGGGTVDIACHKIVDDGLEEVHYPTGKNWGGGCVDDVFIEWLQQMFGVAFMNDFKLSSPNHYSEILDYFQVSKASFFKKKTRSNKTHPVELPNEFVDLLYDNIDVDRMLQDYSTQHYFVKITEESQTLLIDVELWKKWFDKVIKQITDHIEGSESLYRLLVSDDCKYLYLVGGFAQSRYFQHKMKLHFSVEPYNLKVIVPSNPILCIVTGAAYFGMNKVMMKARVMPCTYGFWERMTEQQAIKWGVSKKYIAAHKLRDGTVEGYFHILTKKGDRVVLNQSVTSTSKIQREDHDLVVPFSVLKSNSKEPITIDDGEELGKMQIPISKYNRHFHRQNRWVEFVLEFYFDDTMLKAYVHPENDPGQRKVLELIM